MYLCSWIELFEYYMVKYIINCANFASSFQLYIQWCDDYTATEVCFTYKDIHKSYITHILSKMTFMAPHVSIYDHGMHLMVVCVQISRPRYSSPYSWPLNHVLAYQKQWEIRRKMNAIGWSGKNLEQVFLFVCVQINEA